MQGRIQPTTVAAKTAHMGYYTLVAKPMMAVFSVTYVRFTECRPAHHVNFSSPERQKRRDEGGVSTILKGYRSTLAVRAQ